MQIYIAVPPESAVPGGGYTPAHIIYRVKGTRLYLARGHGGTQGGTAVITLTQTGGGPSAPLVEEIAEECVKRSFENVVIDTGGITSPYITRLTCDIAAAIAPRKLFVPEQLGVSVTEAIVLVQTALSGGYLSHHLDEAADMYGIDRIAAEIDRVIMSFKLPAYTGMGEPVTPERDKELRAGGSVYFSDALCVKYYMRMINGVRHFILSDDAETINRKLELISSRGIKHAFLYLPHIADIISGITSPDE